MLKLNIFLLLLLPLAYSQVCPVSLNAPLEKECYCEGETTTCEAGKFCYSGGCKDSARCTLRPDIDKNVFYGAKVYGQWDASIHHMTINFTTPFDVTLNSISWKNAVTDELKFDKANHGEWKVDHSNACEPVYILNVTQTKFFGQGSKFKIKGSQLNTILKVDATETITTVMNKQSYTYERFIKNTVPVLVNLETKTTIDVRFRTTSISKHERQDFVLFTGAEDNFADGSDQSVIISMQVHSRTCVNHTLPDTGVRVGEGKKNTDQTRPSKFKWGVDATTGKISKKWEYDLCVEELEWTFYPAKYHENTYEIDLEFTLVGTGETFTTTAAIDIKQGDVLADVGFDASIDAYKTKECTGEKMKTFSLGQKFFTKIVLDNLVVPTTNITCNTYKIIQEKDNQEIVTDMKAETKYNFVELKSTVPKDSHICGAELESHHFHVSVDGYHTTLETEIEIEYDQKNTRRHLIRTPLTRDMLQAAGYYENEVEVGSAEFSEEDLMYQNTKRAPETDDMVLEMFIEAEKSVGILSGEENATLRQILFMSVIIAALGYTFGYFRGKFTGENESYVSLIEMQE